MNRTILHLDAAPTSRERHGFTLIELLVVIAIISLLVSILIPSLQKAKEQTQRLLCQTNLRGLGMAFILYAEENEGYWPGHSASYISVDNPTWVPSGLPNGCQAPSVNPDYDVAKGALYPYADSRGLYLCPSFNDSGHKKLNYAQYQELFGENAQDNPAQFWYRPRSQNSLYYQPELTPQPETLVNLVDKGSCFDANFVGRNEDYGIPNGDYLDWRHGGTLNFLMVDSHVENYAQGDEDVLWDWSGKIWF